MKFLLPHRFKKIGRIITPLGFLFWLLMQRGYVTKLMSAINGTPMPESGHGLYHTANVAVAIISFFAFIFGLFFISFSKEKKEDEMVRHVRLESLQLAALLQFIILILGFLSMLYFGEAGQEGLVLFFTFLLLTFWLTYIIRFNYIINYKRA